MPPVGPGRYDDLATYVREKTDAECVVVIVFGGDKGSSFSLQATETVDRGAVVEALRSLASDLERESS